MPLPYLPDMVAEQVEQLRAMAAGLEELRARCATFEAQQARAAEELAGQVAARVAEVSGNLVALYTGVKDKVSELETKNAAIEATIHERTGRIDTAARVIAALDKRVETLELRGGIGDDGGGKKVSLLHRKDMKPKTLEKEDGWRRWKSDVEDYVEEVFEGMRGWLEKAKDADEPVTRDWFEGKEAGAGARWWTKGDMRHRYL